MKPLIGLVPLVDETKDSLWMLPGYMDGIREAGGIPVMFPLTKDKEDIAQLLENVQGILLTGGHDVDPALYGEEAIPECGTACRERDAMETELLDQALQKDIPVLGICRGIQFLNAYLGGSLYQDLPAQYTGSYASDKTQDLPAQYTGSYASDKTADSAIGGASGESGSHGTVEHHQSPPYDVPVHSVSIMEDSGLYRLLGKKELRVNSYHHQAIKQKADSLKVMAVSEDGLIEAVEMPGKKYVWALQWHPEFSFHKDDDSRKIFEEFVRNCINGRRIK